MARVVTGLEPVVEFRAGLNAALDVQFVRAAADTFLRTWS
jgi:hypothetical protein